MVVPAALIVGAFMWVISSAIKWWYLSRTRIEYTHKVDEELLEQIGRPSPEALEKLKKMRENRSDPFKLDTDPMDAFVEEDNKDEKEKPENVKEPPRNMFDEIDHRRKHGKNGKKNKGKRYDRTMFDDPVQELYRKRQSKLAKTNSTDEAK